MLHRRPHPEDRSRSSVRAALLALACASFPGAQAPAEPLRDGTAAKLATALDGVTVYPGHASVVRRCELPAGGGAFLVADLPYALDPDSVRVRATGGEVVTVEVRERFRPAVADERVEEVRARIAELEARLGVLTDEREVLATLRESVRGMLVRTSAQGTRDLEHGHPDPVAWRESLAFVREQLTSLDSDERQLEERRRSVEADLADARLDLGRFDADGGVRLREVLLDVVDTGEAGGELRVEYLVGDAGWQPFYDLRAATTLDAVELVYRAKVWQRSGEDWTDAAVTLSTTEPRRGARGPEPRPVWLGLVGPPTAGAELGVLGRDAVETFVGSVRYDIGFKEPAAPTVATVLRNGPAVEFRLPRRETIQSRNEPTRVLVGRADLAITTEHVCVPALDPTVWLRARAVNTSPLAMLAGRASVHLGGSFLGHADFDAVRPGEEFTLHLGADEGVTVERTRLAREDGATGVFHKRATERERWRLVVTNHDGRADADGRLRLVVHEVLPRSAHEDVEVEVEHVAPAFAKGERWAKLEQETGARTWTADLSAGEERVFEVETSVRYPEGALLSRR